MMDIINFAYNLSINPYSWMTFLVFIIGYTWTTKVDDTTTCVAAHVNLLQTEKLDRDGEIPATGTIQWDKGVDIASAATLVIPADGNYHDVTGTDTITALSPAQSQPGTFQKLHFDGILQITHHATNLILPDGKNIYTIGGLELEFIEYEAGKFLCTGYLRGVPVLTNLLSNSEIKVWSLSDANKGLCTLNYDTGAKGAGTVPSVGDACVGANGATGKVISYTTATGAWADGDAAGVLTLGACTGGWTDNEVLTFAGVETAAVNGETVGIVNDPCNNDGTGDWTDADTILSFDTDHYEIASDAADEKTYITGLSFTEGKIYKVEAQLKDGTAAPTDIQLVSLDGAVVEYSSARINTTAAFVTYSCTFEATASTDGVGIITPTSLAGNNIEMKYFICYEITPCCTAADTKAFDGWYKDATADIYRQHWDATYSKNGSFYSLKIVPSAAGDFVWVPRDYDNEENFKTDRGKAKSFGCWIYASTASHARISIEDSAGTSYSPYHSGTPGWEWLKVTRTIDSGTTQVALCRIWCAAAPAVNGDTIVYASQDMFVFGSHIGEGNYQPKQGEWVQFEKYMTGKYESTSSWSDVAATVLNIEADSDGMIPKGAKAVFVLIAARDSGSAAGSPYFLLRGSALQVYQFFCWLNGLPNDVGKFISGIQYCDDNGDMSYFISASGAGTFDFLDFRYLGCQVS